MTDPDRVYRLLEGTPAPGCVLYWMQRDQRVSDNWALLFAQEKALETGRSLRVVFCLTPGFIGAAMRQYDFMLKGLQQVESTLSRMGILFELITGNPGEMIPDYIKSIHAGILVSDFNPLRICMQWKKMVMDAINISFFEVDAHNILPCRAISGKSEYAAFTFRKKVEKELSRYLTEIPPVIPRSPSLAGMTIPIDWKGIQDDLQVDRDIAPVDWILPGEEAAEAGLAAFIENGLDGYAANLNDPGKRGQSGLSPWLHFGQLSAQRVALEVQRADADPASKAVFLEELIVRRELADNFCLYNPAYDLPGGFQPWALKTLEKHRDDPREYCYSVEQFRDAATHDDLWNAAQHDLVLHGRMHGFMRMYWAKKILEWTPSAEEAMAVALYLNDRYQLDGRDPSGYAGIAWSIGGTHDRPWGERDVFGMIRYMNYKGCQRKFDVQQYISTIKN